MEPDATTTIESSKKSKKSPFGQLLDAIKQECSSVDIWNEDLQRDLPKKWEKHGNMILLPQNSFQRPEWRMLGRNLWKVVAQSLQCEKLGRKRKIMDDDFRRPYIDFLYGENSWVEHVDNGIKYNYDVTKCMFSIGNIGEKLRIASFDCKGETVVDMFAGIGYFTLPYLIHAKAQYVYACEWNPDALEALKLNLIANKVEDRCTVLEGDCRKVCPWHLADRVNLGLLPTASHYWLTACRALKSTGGYLHIHENVTLSKLNKTTSVDHHEISAASHNNVKNVSENTDAVRLSTVLVKSRSVDCSKTAGSANGQDENCMRDSRPKMERSGRSLSQSIEEEMEALDAIIRVYDPPVEDSFKEQWSKLDSAYRDFSTSAAKKVFKYLNNLHQKFFLVMICRIGKIKSYGPQIDHVVLDLKCAPYENIPA